MTQSTHQNVNAYFNLTADGVGFLNRPRIVQGKHKNAIPYFACTVQASRGDAGDKTRFDLRIVGGRAKELFEKLLKEFPNLQASDYKLRPTVAVGFRAGDLQPIMFEAQNHQTGEKIQTLSIDARLLKFKFIKVNGQFWYTERDDEQAQSEQQENLSVPSAENTSAQIAA